jgi:hypothetical protein
VRPRGRQVGDELIEPVDDRRYGARVGAAPGVVGELPRGTTRLVDRRVEHDGQDRGEPMSVSGGFSCPPPGRSAARLRGESHIRRQLVSARDIGYGSGRSVGAGAAVNVVALMSSMAT